jgi:hypothetical protein
MSREICKFLPAIATFGILAQTMPAMAQYTPNNGYMPPPGGDVYNRNSNFSNTPPPNYQQGHVAYVPAGLSFPVTLSTAISTDVARAGDLVQAQLSGPIDLGNGCIPPGSTVVGQVTEAKSGGFLGRSGMMTVKFNRLRLPNGQEVPMSAHIVGGIGKYQQVGNGSDTFKGEGMGTKVGQLALRGAVGAGAGAALGTAVGAIAGAGTHQPWYMGGHSMAARGAGRGAWSGAAIGGGLGVADSLLLRKGKNVTIPSGQSMQLQLDSPMQLSQGFQTGQF